MKPRWTGAPIVRDAHDEVRVLTVTLRFPDGARSGGEVRLQRYFKGAPVPGAPGASVEVAIEPGGPDSLPAEFWTWLEARLKGVGEVAGEVSFVSVEPERPAPAPPVPEPGIRLG